MNEWIGHGSMQREPLRAQIVYSMPCPLEALVPVCNTGLTGVNLTLNERFQVTDSIPAVAAERKGYYRVIHEYPDTRLRFAVFLATLQPFDNHSTGKWSEPRCNPGSSLVRLRRIHDRSRERLVLSIIEEPQCRIYSRHLIVVREVRIDGPVERKKLGVRGDSMVCLRAILDSSTSEACDEFIDVSYALNWAKRMAIPRKWYMNGWSPTEEIRHTQCSNIFPSRTSTHIDYTPST